MHGGGIARRARRMPARNAVHTEPDVRRSILVGAVALAIAMGIGRFAFTPLLPLMMRDGTLDAALGAEWAAANYLGYLLGALSAARFARAPQRGLLIGLAGVALTTLVPAAPWPALGALAGPAARLMAGVFSAWTLVCASAWCLGRLARLGAGHLGAWIYTGVGLGIAGAGVLAWIGGTSSAGTLWLAMGLLALAGAAAVAGWLFRSRPGPGAPDRPSHAAVAPHPTVPAPAVPGAWPMVLSYGAFGFGYIVLATFLPAMAREQVADPRVFGLTWPLFGLAAALSVAVAARWLTGWPRRRVWALAQTLMAAGTALPLFDVSLPALAVSAVLVGGTFMVATMAGLQWARERAPHDPTRWLARMTVAFACGQIAGPVVVRVLGTGTGSDAIFWGNAIATAVLATTAGWLWAGAMASTGRASRPGPQRP